MLTQKENVTKIASELETIKASENTIVEVFTKEESEEEEESIVAEEKKKIIQATNLLMKLSVIKWLFTAKRKT